MNVFSVGRHVARKVTTQVDLSNGCGRRLLLRQSRMLQPRGVLVPIRVVADRQKAAHSRD